MPLSELMLAQVERQIIPRMEHDVVRWHLGAAKHGSQISVDALVMSNLPFIIRQAKHYGMGELTPDIIQAGVCGLIRAIPRWRFGKSGGSKFLTYASHYIKLAMMEEIGKHRRVYILPQGAYERIRRRTGENPKPAIVVGLDAAAGVTAGIPTAYRELAVLDAKRLTDKAFSAMNKREAKILQLRFAEGLTLDVIGRRFRISRERVRQVQNEALWRARMALGGLGGLQTVRGVLADLETYS